MCDLDLEAIKIFLSNGTSTHDVEYVCPIILKSIHKCRSYTPDKILTLMGDLDLEAIQKLLSNGTSSHDVEQLCQVILKSKQK